MLSSACPADIKVNGEHLRRVEELMDNSVAYSEEVSFSSLIEWEGELVGYYRSKGDEMRMYLVMKMAVYACSYGGNFTTALKRIAAMHRQAEQTGSDVGKAIVFVAMGDTYVNAGLEEEAVSLYVQALKIIGFRPETSLVQEQIMLQLIPVLVRMKNFRQVEEYLARLEALYDGQHQENRFLLHVYRAYKDIYVGNLSQAADQLNLAEETLRHYHYSFYVSILQYIKSEYAQVNGDYEEALQLNTRLARNSKDVSIQKLHKNFLLDMARIYAQLGRNKDACRLYRILSESEDSLHAKSYSSQINLLRTVYQVDRLKLETQNQRNRITFTLILGGVLILVCVTSFLFYIRRGNRRLAASKERLIQMRKDAEKSIMTKSLFISNMSHEIRTPLNALSGFTSILTDPDIDSNTRQQCYHIIQQNSDLLLKLIDDVLDLSNIEVGKLPFHFGSCEAVDLCRSVIDTVEHIKQTAASVSFETELTAFFVWTDEARLQQLLFNLLINATKFTSEGSIVLLLRREDDDNLFFSVTDTGCGIAPDKQDRIFERFEKFHEHIQGSGLGLAICKLIVEQLGGHIWLDRDYTDGCRICFTHPVRSTDGMTVDVNDHVVEQPERKEATV